MKLDLSMYRLNVTFIQSLTKSKTPKERFEFISMLAIVTGVPIIAVCHYVGEIYGFSDELLSKISTLMLFYNIKEVIDTSKL